MIKDAKHPVLYVVATPIGNLRDITLRALEVLKSVDVVVAEDTRVCGKLLRHFGIDARVIASHEHNERRSAKGIVKLLADGKSVALTTDAGTPAISDPGSEVVARVRAEGFAVVPVPGASALTAALSVCGQQLSCVTFCGFLPAKASERRKKLGELAGVRATLVFYEAPHRIVSTLGDMTRIVGADIRIVLCRELTKLHEEIYEGTVSDAEAWVKSSPERERGEFVIVIERSEPARDDRSEEGERVLALLMSELPLKKAVALAAEISGVRKNVLYRRALELVGDAGAQ